VSLPQDGARLIASIKTRKASVVEVAAEVVAGNPAAGTTKEIRQAAGLPAKVPFDPFEYSDSEELREGSKRERESHEEEVADRAVAKKQREEEEPRRAEEAKAKATARAVANRLPGQPRVRTRRAVGAVPLPPPRCDSYVGEGRGGARPAAERRHS